MTYLYLRTETKAEMEAALIGAGLLEEIDGDVVPVECEGTEFVVVQLSERLGTLLDEDGNEYENLTPVPGYHVNVRTDKDDVITALESVTIDPEPETPKVIWMG